MFESDEASTETMAAVAASRACSDQDLLRDKEMTEAVEDSAELVWKSADASGEFVQAMRLTAKCVLRCCDGARFRVHEATLITWSKQLARCFCDLTLAGELPFEADRETASLLLRMMYSDGPSSRRLCMYWEQQGLLCKAMKLAHKYEMVGLLGELENFMVLTHTEGSPQDTMQLFELACRLELANLREAAAQRVRKLLHKNVYLDQRWWQHLKGSEAAELLLPFVKSCTFDYNDAPETSSTHAPWEEEEAESSSDDDDAEAEDSEQEAE